MTDMRRQSEVVQRFIEGIAFVFAMVNAVTIFALLGSRGAMAFDARKNWAGCSVRPQVDGLFYLYVSLFIAGVFGDRRASVGVSHF